MPEEMGISVADRTREELGMRAQQARRRAVTGTLVVDHRLEAMGKREQQARMQEPMGKRGQPARMREAMGKQEPLVRTQGPRSWVSERCSLTLGVHIEVWELHIEA